VVRPMTNGSLGLERERVGDEAEIVSVIEGTVAFVPGGSSS
jgi:hypothetical protein